MGLAAAFDGGVAQLSGEVDEQAGLDLVREFIGRLDGVFAVWDRLRVAGRAPMTLDLGCGKRP